MTVPRRCIPLSCLTARLLHTFCCHPWNVKEGIASRLYLDCGIRKSGYCLARLQKTNEKVGYITVLETLTGPTEITFPMYENLLKRKLTKNGSSVSHQNRHQCLVSTTICICICSSEFKYSSAQDCFQLRLLLDNKLQ